MNDSRYCTNISDKGPLVQPETPVWKTTLLGICLYSIVLTTIFGNLLVLFAVVKDRRLRTPFNLYIVNLALTDFGVAITAMSFQTTNNILGFWPFGEFMCGVWIFFDYGMTFVSVFTLILISVDRFWSVTWSVHYKLHHNRRICLLSIAAVWLFMLVLWIPPCISDRIVNSVPNECLWDPAKNRVFVIIVAVLGHHGSCIILLVCYIRVFLFMHKRKSLVAAFQASGLHEETSMAPSGTEPETSVSVFTTQLPSVNQHHLQPASGCLSHLQEGGPHRQMTRPTENNFLQVPTRQRDGNSQSCQRRQTADTKADHSRHSNRRERKVFITLSYVIIGYLVCWVPFHVVFDLSSVDVDLVPESVFNVTFWLTYVNSTINPFLYHFSSAEFRRAFKRILCRR